MYIVQIINDQCSKKTSKCTYHLQKLMSMSVVYEYRDDAMVVCTMISDHTPDSGILQIIHTCIVNPDNYYAD